MERRACRARSTACSSWSSASRIGCRPSSARAASAASDSGCIATAPRAAPTAPRTLGIWRGGVAPTRVRRRASACGTSSEREFRTAVQAVKAEEPAGDDDLPENTFGGMVQASEDVAPCSDHTKLVFIIGDHGYDGAKQESRGHERWTEA